MAYSYIDRTTNTVLFILLTYKTKRLSLVDRKLVVFPKSDQARDLQVIFTSPFLTTNVTLCTQCFKKYPMFILTSGTILTHESILTIFGKRHVREISIITVPNYVMSSFADENQLNCC